MAKQNETVDFKHPDWTANQDKWALIDDMCDSCNLQSHLVRINPDDTSKENSTRNDQIFKRAVFVAIAGHTSKGLVGKAFSKEPKMEIPTSLEYVNENVDGAGISLIQQAQDAMRETIRKGRYGLLIDMAQAEEGKEFSKADMLFNFSTIQLFKASQIINWRTVQIGSQIGLKQVVWALTEQIDGPDGFSFEDVDVRLELRLDPIESQEGGTSWMYTMHEWRKATDGNVTKEDWVRIASYLPTDGKGDVLERIPFIFGGSEANTPRIDPAPMYDMCKVNQGHWNNSAVYEDSVFLVGQAQPWMSGLTQDMIDLFKANNMYVGSGRMIGVPGGEQFGFAQAEPNSLAKEAMDDKVQLMVSLGAMLVQPGTVAKTATQSAGELLTQHSVLSLSTSNVSEAYLDALKFVALFMNEDRVNDLVFELNQDFVEPDVDFNMLREMIAGFMGGAIPPVDYHEWMKKSKLTDKDKELDEFTAELAEPGGLGLDDEDESDSDDETGTGDQES